MYEDYDDDYYDEDENEIEYTPVTTGPGSKKLNIIMGITFVIIVIIVLLLVLFAE